MADNTIIQQGNFTADGSLSTVIDIRSDVDWMRVYNYTAAGTSGGGTDLPFMFYFQRGMATGTGLQWTKLDTVANDPTTVGVLTAPNGFTLFNSGDRSTRLGAAVASTGYTNVVRPIVSTASTAGLASGSIVRLYGFATGQPINGMDFAIDTIVTNTSFRIASALATAPGAAGTNGFYRIIKFDPLFYPPFRYVVNVTAAASAVVTLSVPSLYQVGQKVQFFIPSVYGMTQLDGQVGTITAVTDTVATQTITVNIDTSAFSAFTHPTTTTGANPFSRAVVVPYGMDTGYALSQVPIVDWTSGSLRNIGQLGMQLGGGASAGAAAGPAGASGDAMYWVAGKSFAVDNNI